MVGVARSLFLWETQRQRQSKSDRFRQAIVTQLKSNTDAKAAATETV
ncbi:hypothetical protein [Calothrix sp. NIES-2100]